MRIPPFIYTLLLMLGLFGSKQALAQELFCRVTVRPEGSAVMDKRVLGEMERVIRDFMNQRPRTEDKFSSEERILCNMIISITSSPRTGFYKATANVQAIRPVYGASLESPILNFLDKDWEFEFTEGMPMDFNDNTLAFQNDLTALLSFYAYMILGLDYDSFGKLQGRPYYQKAQYIATNASQASTVKGWRTFDGTNTRFALMDNYMDQRVAPFREGIYQYHRLGLDVFASKPEEARQNIISCLQKIEQVQQVKPLNIAISTFLDTKGNEIVGAFSQAPPQEKQQVFAILQKVDPTKTERYQALLR